MYKYVIIYKACNNDTSEEKDFTILLEEEPCKEEVRELIKKSYDGVWVPDMETIVYYFLLYKEDYGIKK